MTFTIGSCPYFPSALNWRRRWIRSTTIDGIRSFGSWHGNCDTKQKNSLGSVQGHRADDLRWLVN
jgi:hypothetical protein